MPLVTSGVETGSLRQLALQRMADLGLVCRDIRTVSYTHLTLPTILRV